jgi:endonuclease/exonuclease/phosphatase family metal-dependent hydrolase
VRLFFIHSLLAFALCAPCWARTGNLEIEEDPVSSGRYSSTKAKPVRFSIATYNVRARPLLDEVAPKFKAIGPLLDRFDIVALQECFTEHRLLWRGTSFPVRVHDGTRTDWFRPVASGLSTLARFPLRETLAKKFDQPEGLRFLLRGKKDGFASKGVLLTRFDLGGGRTLDVYNTHMEAGGDDASNEVRRQQARQLIGMIQTHSPPEHAVIVAGDFNMRAPGRKKQSLAPRYPRNLEGLSRPQIYEAVTRELGLVNAATISGESPSSLIDHILYRSGSSLRLEPVAWERDTRRFLSTRGEPWSDHEPVITTFLARP